jgi:hypothetical protein
MQKNGRQNEHFKQKYFDFLQSKIFKLNSLLFEDFMQHSLVVKTLTFQDKLLVKFSRAKQSLTLNIQQTGCPKMSVSNYQSRT